MQSREAPMPQRAAPRDEAERAGLDPLRRGDPRGLQPADRTRRLQSLHRRRGVAGRRRARGRRLGEQRTRRARRPARLGRDARTRRPRQPLSARARHPRPLRQSRRSRALPSRLSPAHAARRRTGPARFALDRTAPRRACRARRALLHAGAGRGGPRLPDHHDLRRDAEPGQRAGAGASTGCRRSTPASTIRATSPRPTSRA